MSKRYKGAILSSTPPTTSTSSASGVWTEQQFMQGVATGSWPALAGAPTIGTATAGALSASVTFTAPTYTGSGITGYTVTSSPGGITGTGASSPITVSGLTAGTPYTFTVTATTAAGQGPASAASNSVTPTAPNYIEDVFSTYLYTGTGASQTITNNINASTKGALFWLKSRNSAEDNRLVDTVRGPNLSLASNNTLAQDNDSNRSITATSSGFTTGPTASSPNTSGTNYASWTFAKQPKFFDVVTYTGNGNNNRLISHNLGSTPGCVIVKCTSHADTWAVWHRSLTSTQYSMALNTTAAQGNAQANQSFSFDGSVSMSATQFVVSQESGNANSSDKTYVAYLFAHDAGGFGLTGTDNVISCGSYTGNGSSTGPVISLGYEPQWLLIKKADSATANTGWAMFDNMRGLRNSGGVFLYANSSAAEDSSVNIVSALATGFQPVQSGFLTNGNGSTYIYIAIRRGPMKVPTSGTSVFSPYTATLSAGTTVNAGLTPDLLFAKYRPGTDNPRWVDRLRGFANATGGTNPELYSNETTAETTSTAWSYNWNNTGYVIGNALNGLNSVIYALGRAPSFFDEVCYTGDGTSNRAIPHNLGVVPELIINRPRNYADNWEVYQKDVGLDSYFYLNSTAAPASNPGNWSTMTSSVFGAGYMYSHNYSARTYVTYLFASCPGVSKVGSYTGTGATQTISCGFTGGARFVMIKRTDSTGDWYYWDTSRGMVSGTDPNLLMNSNVGETNTNSIYTTTGGFQIVSTAAGINASGGTYIFLAIA